MDTHTLQNIFIPDLYVRHYKREESMSAIETAILSFWHFELL